MRKETLAYNIRSIELAATVAATGGISMSDSLMFRAAADAIVRDDSVTVELIEHIIDMAIGRNYKSFNPKKQIEQYQRNIR